eukprot:CAMPEP_0206270606 /NCGR_PEP_ID=MMETSP0047_2-20121206/32959_1 /ASSEMBLY_ACC=CAM_ASM_000192 /TAXON_ID=195065 /ORGANISM="Chroomonas mesostigmatica_cf, Strain CCMP1168" /LENGTH=49 /DNA_ID= /DNA_START= /DNA_END= /DNA_ORIENTATION=
MITRAHALRTAAALVQFFASASFLFSTTLLRFSQTAPLAVKTEARRQRI